MSGSPERARHKTALQSESERGMPRVPPHSTDAEQAVLGGLLLTNRAWWQVADLLAPDDFYRRDHQLIFRAIAELSAERRPCDAVTLGEWFESQGLAEQVGGSGYVIELASTTPSAANVRAYAEIVREKSARRRLIEAAVQLADDAFEASGKSALELAGEAQTALSKLLANEPCDLEPVKPVMRRVFERLTERYQAGGKIHGLTTGIAELDAVLGGLRPGQLGLIAGRPKMGKTTLAMNIAEHVAIGLRCPVAVFSFEMQPEELVDRMLCSLGNVESDRIRSGELDDSDWSGVNVAVQRLHGAPMFISRPRRARVEHLAAQVRRQHAQTPLALVVIDYLQLMEAPGDNRAQGIGDITRGLKLLAGELGIPVLLLSQLNRDLEKRPDKRPIPADLRDSGAIEQDADFVLFVYRDEVYHPQSRWRGSAELIVALQRNGPTGDVRVRYEPAMFRFSDLPSGWEPLPEAAVDGAKEPRGWRRRSRAGPGRDAQVGGA